MLLETKVGKKPKVSIIIPVYNAKKVFKETLDSIEAQSYDNWEVVIVDDCSTDGSLEYITELVGHNKKYKVYSMEQNSGPGAATAYGFEKSSGDLVAFLDSDDVWSNDKLEKQVRFMLDNDYEFTCTDYEQVDGDSKPIGRVIKCKPRANYINILRTNPVGSSTVIITAELLNKVDIPLIRKDNDYALWLELLKVTSYIYGMNEILMFYRVWPQSISYNRFKSVKYHWEVYKKYEKFSSLHSILLIVMWGIIKVFRIK